MKYFYSIIFLFFIYTLSAQPSPAPQQNKSIAILGATAHIGNGQKIENSAVILKNGRIQFVGALEDAPSLPDDGGLIDANGQHIYPGFIALESSLGLIEIGGVRATRDSRELGNFNPSLRSIIAYNTDSQVIPTVRSNGVLIAHIVPQGATMPGQSSVVQLDAWNWEDAALATDVSLRLNWPIPVRRTGWWAEPGGIKLNDKYQNQVEEIKSFFQQAKAYLDQNTEKTNLKFEALKDLFDNKKKLFVKVNHAKAMMDAVLFAEEFDLPIVIVGAEDSWMIIDFLKEKGTPIILNATHELPDRKEDDIDITYKLPSLLDEAGILFAISRSGYYDQRNLPFQAGQAVAYGLDYESAIKSISLGAAEILGIQQNYGSLEEGKSATLFISEGDVLDMRSSKLIAAFIDGRSIDLNNKQTELYKKFTEKYQAQ